MVFCSLFGGIFSRLKLVPLTTYIQRHCFMYVLRGVNLSDPKCHQVQKTKLIIPKIHCTPSSQCYNPKFHSWKHLANGTQVIFMQFLVAVSQVLTVWITSSPGLSSPVFFQNSLLVSFFKKCWWLMARRVLWYLFNHQAQHTLINGTHLSGARTWKHEPFQNFAYNCLAINNATWFEQENKPATPK